MPLDVLITGTPFGRNITEVMVWLGDDARSGSTEAGGKWVVSFLRFLVVVRKFFKNHETK